MSATIWRRGSGMGTASQGAVVKGGIAVMCDWGVVIELSRTYRGRLNARLLLYPRRLAPGPL